MFIKDKLTKGAFKLDTSKFEDSDSVAVKPPAKSQFQSLKGFKDKSYVEFGGTDEYLEGTTRDFSFGTADFTISGWVWLKGGYSFPIMSRYKDADNYWYYQLGWSGSNLLSFFDSEIGGTADAGGTMLALTGGVSQNAWHHFVLSVDRDGNFTEYIDGSSSASYIVRSGNTGNLNISAPTHIGRYHTSYAANASKIADLRWYNTAVTSKQATRLYQQSFDYGENAADLKNNLVDWYTFGQRNSKIYGSEFDYIKANISDEKFGFENRTLIDKSNDVIKKHPSVVSELVSNQTFDSNLSGWTTSGSDWTQNSGKAQTLGHAKELTLDGVTAKTGFTYEISADAYLLGSSGSLTITVGGTSSDGGVVPDANGESFSANLRPVENGAIKFTSIVISVDGSNGVAVDNVSIKEHPSTGFIPKNMESGDIRRQRTIGGKLV